MKVLAACEESQEVCKAFRALGHEAYSCDIQEPSGGHPFRKKPCCGSVVSSRWSRPILLSRQRHGVRAAATAISMGNSIKVCLPRIGPKTAQRPSPESQRRWRNSVIALAQREQAKALDAADLIDRLTAENAALREYAKLFAGCDTCRHSNYCKTDCPCDECEQDVKGNCYCKDCERGSNWGWRGLPEDPEG